MRKRINERHYAHGLGCMHGWRTVDDELLRLA